MRRRNKGKHKTARPKSPSALVCHFAAPHLTVFFCLPFCPCQMLTACASIASGVILQLPVIAPAAYQTALNTSAFFFSLHGQSAYATGALQSLLSTYGWNRLAILYLEHDSSVAGTPFCPPTCVPQGRK